MGTLLSFCAGLAFCAIGTGALAAPGFSASQYGLPSTDRAARAFVRGLGARDLVLGLLVWIFLAAAMRGALSCTLAVASIAGAADFFIVRNAAGPKAPSLIVHGGGTIALIAGAAIVAIGW